PGKEALVGLLEQEVGDQADQSDDEDAEDHLPGIEQALAVHDHVADAALGTDQLGDDDIGPGPAEHEAQDLGNLRRGAGQQHAQHDARAAGAQRLGGLHEVEPAAADGDGNHQDDLENRADDDDAELLRLADAGPEDEQRDEGGGGKVAREGYEGFEEGFDALEGAHQDAERHGEDRGDDEAADHAPDGEPDIDDEAVFGEQRDAGLQRLERIGEEQRRHDAAQGDATPDGKEQHEKQNPQDGTPSRGHGLQRFEHGLYLMKLSSTMGPRSGIFLITPASSWISAASFMKACSSPLK